MPPGCRLSRVAIFSDSRERLNATLHKFTPFGPGDIGIAAGSATNPVIYRDSTAPPGDPCPSAAESGPPRGPVPWGATATLVFVALTFVASELIAGALSVVLLRLAPGIFVDTGNVGWSEDLVYTGYYVALVQWVRLPALAVIVLLVLWRGFRITQYLGASTVQWRHALGWVPGLFLLLGAVYLTARMLDRPIAQDWMLRIYETAGWMPGFVLAFCLAAPIFEETLFRGFMMRGLAYSRAGSTGALVLSTSLWTALHMQYDAFGLAVVFVMGLYFGIAWLTTRSLGLVVVLHMLANGAALVNLALIANSS